MLDIPAFDVRAVVLVEGISDRIAVETAAVCLGRNLAAEGITVVPMGGVHAVGRFLRQYGPKGWNRQIAGLFDAGEEQVVRRAVERAGFGSGSPLSRADLEGLGFFLCRDDLEDELIRALGAAAVQAVIAAQNELDSFRTLQKEPAWRGRSVESQLHRFLGSGATRKIRYARLLVGALDPAQFPRPLREVVARHPLTG